jgi:Uma2 family endonuclease
MGMPAIRHRYTPAQVRELTDKAPRYWPRYELIDGELIVTPSPGWPHQFACKHFLLELERQLAENPVGTVLHSPADIKLQPDSINQPDVFVMDLVPSGQQVASFDDLPTWDDVKHLLLAVEVISPSSIRTDRVRKRDFYMKSPVDEYWVVDPEARAIERWKPDQEEPEIVHDTLEWVPEGSKAALLIDVKALFEKIWNDYNKSGLR